MMYDVKQDSFLSQHSKYASDSPPKCYAISVPGVGIVLITVSGVAWRLTATDAPSCRAMLGLGGGYDEDYTHGGRFLSRQNGSGGFTGPFSASAQGANAPGGAGRSQHPYAGEFQI